MRFIWATRGLNWGFRFLSRGGLVDPLPTYSAAFEGFEGAHEVWSRTAKRVAVRFDDPLGRRDRAGRIIPHDFVIFDETDGPIDSMSAAIEVVWPLVRDTYADDYGRDVPEGLSD